MREVHIQDVLKEIKGKDIISIFTVLHLYLLQHNYDAIAKEWLSKPPQTYLPYSHIDIYPFSNYNRWSEANSDQKKEMIVKLAIDQFCYWSGKISLLQQAKKDELISPFLIDLTDDQNKNLKRLLKQVFKEYDHTIKDTFISFIFNHTFQYDVSTTFLDCNSIKSLLELHPDLQDSVTYLNNIFEEEEEKIITNKKLDKIRSLKRLVKYVPKSMRIDIQNVLKEEGDSLSDFEEISFDLYKRWAKSPIPTFYDAYGFKIESIDNLFMHKDRPEDSVIKNWDDYTILVRMLTFIRLFYDNNTNLFKQEAQAQYRNTNVIKDYQKLTSTLIYDLVTSIKNSDHPNIIISLKAIKQEFSSELEWIKSFPYPTATS